MRIALGLEYDGTPYMGWQLQKHSPMTVQNALEKALGRVANHEVRVHCAGRTDTGVHASGQVVHFDTSATRAMREWIFGANANLPKSVCVLWAKEVDEGFHARFSATARHYRYVIFNRPVRPTFLSNRTSWEFRELDADLMQRAASCLHGEHDFSSFRASGCQAKSPVRYIMACNVSRQENFIFIDIQANAFLHHMVRNIAGVLMEIGSGKKPVSWVEDVLQARDRRFAGVTAPPHGLYLTGVDYPQEFELPSLSSTELVW